MTGNAAVGLNCQIAVPAITPPISNATPTGTARLHKGRLTNSLGCRAALPDSRESACSMSSRTSVASLRRFFTFFSRYRAQQFATTGRHARRQASSSPVHAQDRHENLRDVVAVECALSRQHFVQHASECEYVRPPIDVRPFACSGDMYAAVPRITPAFVAAMLPIVGELDKFAFDGLGS